MRCPSEASTGSSAQANLYADTPPGVTSDRRQLMLRGWGFNCTCSICSSAEKTAESDGRRKRINSLLQEIAVQKDDNPKKVDTLADKLLELVELEHMAPVQARYYEFLADAYRYMGDFKKAWKNGKLALEFWLRYEGEDSEHIDDVMAFLTRLMRRRKRAQPTHQGAQTR